MSAQTMEFGETEHIRELLEHSPQPGIVNPDLLGAWTTHPSGVFVCAKCMSRLAGRGILGLFKPEGMVWKDDAKPISDCAGCA